MSILLLQWIPPLWFGWPSSESMPLGACDRRYAATLQGSCPA